MRKIGLLFLGTVVLAVAAGIVLAATGATISFLDSTDQPEYQVAAATVVDDDGCDIVTMMMVDATGGITDVDTFCLDLVTGIGTDWTDWGSHQSGYIPIVSPVTYAVFDTYLNDACDTDENSYACSDYLLSGTVTCLAETFHEVIDVPGETPAIARVQAGTPYSVCGAPAPVGVCSLPIPSNSVVGDLPFETQLYYSPGKASPGLSVKPGTYIVVGQDATESFYKIVLACQFVWVPKESMQPSFQPPQNGAALPTRIVS